ncbi:YdbH family protein [Brenneria rubrifaciens]|uniref:YdbH family protein n=1 Tax=Brenneria rubrifaciens TaxID=55213 RepID=A0A4P8QSH9_9GAMM|nr:YdbH family protein [Brenneria rubrifaciens]QCR08499.1 YdbH family protein [Brenneria rubrifaciens]
MIKKYVLPGAALIVLLLFVLWRAMPQWLPHLAGFGLPADMSLTLRSSPVWRDWGLQSDGFTLTAGECTLLEVRNIVVHRQSGRWKAGIDTVTVNSDCMSYLASDDNNASARLSQWQQRLPVADITIEKFTLQPWQDYAGRVRISTDGKQRQTLHYQGEQLAFQTELNRQHLILRDGMLATPAGYFRLQLSGEIDLADVLPQAPVQGVLKGQLDTGQMPRPVSMRLSWQHQQGAFSLLAAEEDEPLVMLPWQLSQERIQVNNGIWRWPYAAQPLSGRISLTLQNWRQGLEKTRIDARMNLLTQGHNGKANAVLVLGPGHIGLGNSELRFQLTGQANLSDLSFTASLPGILQGSLLNPELLILPGGLLRAWGSLGPQFRLEEARWPLAGVRISPAGVNGRLQAILKARHSYWGRFNLHLDGQAQDFWPDQGKWQWRYWGSGQLPPLKGEWDVAGRGFWRDSLIEVSRLSSGLNQLGYGLAVVRRPRLTIVEPVRWQRARSATSFQGALQLESEQVDFSNGGYLPPTLMRLSLQGNDPSDFLIKGQIQAQDIGPVSLRGRWDGERLRGNAWWPRQSLTVFQPLLSPRLNMKIRAGQFYAQAAFSAARGQGFRAGGHWVVNNGGVWLRDGEVGGVNFVLPYRLKSQRWELGIKRPVTLRIAMLDNLFRMTAVRVDLRGYYPFSEKWPLTISQAGMEALGGHISLLVLRWPQREDALFTVKSVELSELITALKLKQFAMSGRVSGVLPLNFNHPEMLIQRGRFTNDRFLTIRMDKQFADELAGNNMARGVAIDWMRYLEIGRAHATVELSNQGELALVSQIQGKNPLLSAQKQVILNYRHQENIFQLWRSLRFGDNLQDTLEQQANE